MKRVLFYISALIVLAGCAAPPPVEKPPMTVFYPPLPQKPRLQFLYTISSEDDIGREQEAFDQFLLGERPSEKTIGKTYDIGSSPGKIYVMDRMHKKILILDLANRRFDYIQDQRLGALGDPSGIWVTPDDFKYVADMQRRQVVVFGPDNQFVRAYGGKDLFDKPVDVAVYRNSVYVCDMNKHRIFVLDSGTGRLKSCIGNIGANEGQLYRPSHLVVDHKGNLYVNDAFNFRIQKFDPSGKYVKSFGFLGDNIGGFARPKGLAIDRGGHLYVADAAFENVQIFDDATARLLLFFGGSGNQPGSMYLPAGVHIDYENAAYFSNFVDRDFRLEYVLYVGNYFGRDKLNVYGFGQWIGGSLPEIENKVVDRINAGSQKP